MDKTGKELRVRGNQVMCRSTSEEAGCRRITTGATNAGNQSGYYGIDICMCADLCSDANEAVRKGDSSELCLGELANPGWRHVLSSISRKTDQHVRQPSIRCRLISPQGEPVYYLASLQLPLARGYGEAFHVRTTSMCDDCRSLRCKAGRK